MKWDDDYTLENAKNTRRGLLQLAMYAMHVGTGSTLHCRTIKVATIKQYVRAASTFLTLFGVATSDYRKDQHSDAKISITITSVYNELLRWESVPNRREPFTIEMLMNLKSLIASTSTEDDSLLAAASDWFECGLFAGLRLSEWAQEASRAHIDNYQRDFKQQARAFTLEDIRFESETRLRTTAKEAIDAFTSGALVKCWIKFRTQKNGHNGEERLFTRNKKAGGRCFVSAMLRILHRFARLRGLQDIQTPLAVYKNKDGEPTKFITAKDIEQVMRHAAARVYGLDPVKDSKALQLWSAHSLRVGACVILHAMGWTDTQIQWLLRWRSNAFMVYLRNVAIMSTQHHQTLDTAEAMPNFL